MRHLNRIPRWLMILVVSLLPAFATLCLTRFYFHADLFRFVPVYWNDQTWYWHQTYSFSQVGFASGYYLVNEAPARLAFFKFSSAGPLFPVIMGVIGHIVGWGWTTGIILNMAMLMIAVWVFVYLVKPDRVQISLIGCTLLVIGPVLLYIPTNSQESFHQAGTLILAGLFYRLWNGSLSRRTWGAGLLFLIFLSLIRFSWVILLPAYLLIDNRPITLRKVMTSFLIGGLLAFGVYLTVSFTSSPGHNAIVGRVGSFGTSPLLALENLLHVALANLNGSFLGAFDLSQLTVDHVQGIQIAIIIIGAIAIRFPTKGFSSQLNAHIGEMEFHIYNLGVIIILSVMMYLSDGFYRIFGLHVLLSLLLLIAFRRYMLSGAILIVSFAMIGTFGARYQETILPNLSQDSAVIETTRETWATLMPYTPTGDAWCNTLLISGLSLDARILNVPAGIGISFYSTAYLPPTADHPIRSHYLLLDDTGINFLSTGYLHVKQLARTPYGTLYRNLDAACDNTAIKPEGQQGG